MQSENGKKRTRFKYLELADQLRRRIDSGEFAPGDLLPGQRELAETHGVNRSSIRHAIDILEEEGLLECTPSVGITVKRNSAARIYVGYLVDDLSSTFHNEIMRELDQRLAEHNAGLIVCEGDRTDRLEAMGADRVVKSSGLAHTYGRDTLRTVYIGASVPSGHAVLSDDAEGMRAACNHLVGLGHRRIGYYSSCAADMDTRMEAALAASEESGVAIEPACRFSQMSADDVVSTIQAMATPPTALLAYDDDHAIRLMQVARRVGLRIPEQLSLVGFDNIPVTRMLEVPLTTIDFAADAIAHAIVDILFAQNLTEPVTKIISARLVARDSTRKTVD